MTYEWVLSFVAFADHLNFTHAAAELHLSQPALHAQVHKLADEIGRPLYQRVGRALALTAEGSRLAVFGRELKARGDAVLAELRGEAASAPLVLAAGQGALLHLLGPAIRRFVGRGRLLRLLALPGPAAVAAVREARADLGVVATGEPPADLEATRLVTAGQQVVVPAKHRLASRAQLRPRDLDGERIIVAPAGAPHRAQLAHALKLAHARWEVAIEASGWDPMMQFARLGIGIAVVNDFCAVPPGTVGIPLAGIPRVAYHLVARRGFASPPAAQLHTLLVATLAR